MNKKAVFTEADRAATMARLVEMDREIIRSEIPHGIVARIRGAVSRLLRGR